MYVALLIFRLLDAESTYGSFSYFLMPYASLSFIQITYFTMYGIPLFVSY